LIKPFCNQHRTIVLLPCYTSDDVCSQAQQQQRHTRRYCKLFHMAWTLRIWQTQSNGSQSTGVLASKLSWDQLLRLSYRARNFCEVCTGLQATAAQPPPSTAHTGKKAGSSCARTHPLPAAEPPQSPLKAATATQSNQISKMMQFVWP